MNNIRHALGWATTLLHSRLEAEVLLGYLLNKNRAYLFAHPETELDATQEENYKLLVQQRTNGLPIAYITKEREFWSLPLEVNSHTLIPRHETNV